MTSPTSSPETAPRPGRPRRPARRIAFWLLLGLFLAAAAWWLLWFPYDPDNLRRAIPPAAVMVSEHERLAERWESLLQEPVVKAAARAYGIGEEELEEAARDPDVRALVASFGRRATVIGAMGDDLLDDSPDIVVFATWLGAAGQFLRFGLPFTSVPELERVSLGDGRKGWKLESDDLPPGQVLTLTVTEGMLLGCLSGEPDAMRYVLHRVESRQPVAPLFAEWERAPGFDARSAPDRFCFELKPGLPGAETRRICGVLLPDESPASSGWLWGETNLPEVQPAGPEADSALAGLAPLMQPVTAAAVMPFESVRHLVTGELTTLYPVQRVAEQLGSAAGGHVFVAAYGGEYSGRMLNLKVPTLVLGVTTADPAGWSGAVTNLLDVVNAQYGLGLIPRQRSVGGHDVLTVQSSRGGILTGLGPDELPAFARLGDWILLATNVEALGRLLTLRREGQDGANALNGNGSAVAFARLDPAQAARALSAGVAVYQLALLARGKSGHPVLLNRLSTAGDWLTALSPLGDCSLRFVRRDNLAAVHFRCSGE